jgi:hypothetical protein
MEHAARPPSWEVGLKTVGQEVASDLLCRLE